MFRQSTREEDLQRADTIVNGIIDGKILGKGKKNIELSDLLKELFHLKNLLDDDFQTFVEKLLSKTEGKVHNYVLDYMYSKEKMELFPLNTLKNMALCGEKHALSYFNQNEQLLKFPDDACIYWALPDHGSEAGMDSSEWSVYLSNGTFDDNLAEVITKDPRPLDDNYCGIVEGLIEGYANNGEYEKAVDAWAIIRERCLDYEYDYLFDKVPVRKALDYFDCCDDESYWLWDELNKALDNNDKGAVVNSGLARLSDEIFYHYLGETEEEKVNAERAWKFYKMIGCKDDAVWEEIIDYDDSLENRPEPDYKVEKPTEKIDNSLTEPVKPEAKAIPQSIWHQVKVEESSSAEAKAQEKSNAEKKQDAKDTKAVPEPNHQKVPEPTTLPANDPVPTRQQESDVTMSPKAVESQDADALYDIYLKKKTIKNLRAAAKADHPRAMYELGMHYLDLHNKTPIWKKAVKGTKTNKKRGEEWIARAAKLGCQDAKIYKKQPAMRMRKIVMNKRPKVKLFQESFDGCECGCCLFMVLAGIAIVGWVFF